jgi:hypothetical protein
VVLNFATGLLWLTVLILVVRAPRADFGGYRHRGKAFWFAAVLVTMPAIGGFYLPIAPVAYLTRSTWQRAFVVSN